MVKNRLLELTLKASGLLIAALSLSCSVESNFSPFMALSLSITAPIETTTTQITVTGECTSDSEEPVVLSGNFAESPLSLTCPDTDQYSAIITVSDPVTTITATQSSASAETQTAYLVGQCAGAAMVLCALGGDGSEANRYQVDNISCLQEMRTGLSCHYELTQDMDASATSSWNSGAGWEPVGDATSQFTGSLVGNNFSISNLTSNRPNRLGVGLFDYIGSASYINDVVVSGSNISGERYVGVVVARSVTGASMDNVHLSGSHNLNMAGSVLPGSVGDGSFMGGITAKFGGSFTNSSVLSGGQVNLNADIVWTNENMAERTGVHIGGLIGDLVGGPFSANSIVGDVQIDAQIEGRNGTETESGGTQGGNRIGGLVGETSVPIEQSFFQGNLDIDIDGDFYNGLNTLRSAHRVGGLIGEGHEITNSYFEGNVNITDSTVFYTYPGGGTRIGPRIGGLAGVLVSAGITNSYLEGAVRITVNNPRNETSVYSDDKFSGTRLGGLIGEVRTNSLTAIDNINLLSTGSSRIYVYGDGNHSVGGLIGETRKLGINNSSVSANDLELSISCPSDFGHALGGLVGRVYALSNTDELVLQNSSLTGSDLQMTLSSPTSPDTSLHGIGGLVGILDGTGESNDLVTVNTLSSNSINAGNAGSVSAYGGGEFLIGGLVGQFFENQDFGITSTIDQNSVINMGLNNSGSSSSGARWRMGGLIGQAQRNTGPTVANGSSSFLMLEITDSYSLIPIDAGGGVASLGMLLGACRIPDALSANAGDSLIRIERAYSAPSSINYDGSDTVGGVFGLVDAPNSATASLCSSAYTRYRNFGGTINQDYGEGQSGSTHTDSQGLLDAELVQQAQYPTAQWDFTNIWDINEGVSPPFLR